MSLERLLTVLFFMMLTFVFGQDDTEFVWPNGAKAAICLTYDDGLSCHVNTVIPMLNAYNFKGTFYPTLSSPSMYEEMEKWKELAKEGHELGNHTVYHPCRKSLSGMDWVKEHLDLDSYSTEQILDEIKLANSFLLALDNQKERTFAYPCAHFKAGGKSYKDSLYTIFIAARGSSEEQEKLIKPLEIDLFNVPSWAPNENNGEDLISYINEIIANKTLSTITFHGIGAEYMTVSRNSHEEMLKYLDANRDKIWVATFKEVTNYLNSKHSSSEH